MLDYYLRCCYQEPNSPDTTTPFLHEEVDMQEYIEDRLLSNASKLGEVNNNIDLTCQRTHGRLATSWSQKDYEEMDLLFKPVKRKLVAIHPKQSIELSGESIDLPSESVRTRIQLTLKSKGKNIKGFTNNFSVHNVKALTIFNTLKPLLITYPKQSKPNQIVRVQLTEYKQGKGNYQSSRGGNINLHNCSVDQVSEETYNLLDEQGWLIPKNLTPIISPDKLIPKSIDLQIEPIISSTPKIASKVSPSSSVGDDFFALIAQAEPKSSSSKSSSNVPVQRTNEQGRKALDKKDDMPLKNKTVCNTEDGLLKPGEIIALFEGVGGLLSQSHFSQKDCATWNVSDYVGLWCVCEWSGAKHRIIKSSETLSPELMEIKHKNIDRYLITPKGLVMGKSEERV